MLQTGIYIHTYTCINTHAHIHYTLKHIVISLTQSWAQHCLYKISRSLEAMLSFSLMSSVLFSVDNNFGHLIPLLLYSFLEEKDE